MKIAIFLSLVLILGSSVHAEVPSTLNYQGRVLQNGQPFDGTGHFVFGIYEGSTLLWTNKLPVPSPLNDPASIDSSDAKALTVRNGVFTVRLGEGDANNAPVGTDVFFKFDSVQRVRTDVKLKVWFSPAAEGPYTKLEPDITFASVPFAQVAGVALDGVPPGTVVAYGGATPPTGWLLCDGALVSRSGQYARLFEAIGTNHGGGDGSTTFHLPDYRGRFLRMADLESGRDPGGRSAMNSGGLSGHNVGSVQNDEFKSHTHSTSGNAASDDGGGADSHFALGDSDAGRSWPGITLNSTGGPETRPKNAAVLYIIKY